MTKRIYKGESSFVESADYNVFAETLEIELNGGRVYKYFGVPYETFLQLDSATSKGTYYNNNIRGQFSTESEQKAASNSYGMVLDVVGKSKVISFNSQVIAVASPDGTLDVNATAAESMLREIISNLLKSVGE